MFQEDVHRQQYAMPVLQPQPALRGQPYVRIIEEPSREPIRFRCKSEFEHIEYITGVGTTETFETFPTIQVIGYKNPTMVTVSCVTVDPPYRPHPRELGGAEGCSKGVLISPIPTATMILQFKYLRLLPMRDRVQDKIASLHKRSKLSIDPFRTGFQHIGVVNSIDMSRVRLCFQVFCEGHTFGKFNVAFPPVVSQPILYPNRRNELNIVRISDRFCYANGWGKNIIILCGEINVRDIEIRFFESNGSWEAFNKIPPHHTHKDCAFWFMPPQYKRVDIQNPVTVYVHLRRCSDGATGSPVPFTFLPLPSSITKRKSYNMADVLRNLGNGIDMTYPKYLQDFEHNVPTAQGAATSTMQYNIPYQTLTLDQSPRHISQRDTSLNRMNNLNPETSTVVATESVAVQNLVNFDDTCVLNSDELKQTIQSMSLDPSALPEINNFSLNDVTY